jgi:hypothetical protein
MGFVAKGVLYAIVGIAAIGAAIGSGRLTDTRGAMRHVGDAPFGRVALVAIAVGLVGYAVWRFVEAIADPDRRGHDAKGLALRSSYFGRGLLHLALAFSAAKLAFGRSAGQSGQSQQATGRAMALPGGVVLVWIVALGIGAFGVYQLYRAARKKLGSQMRSGEMAVEAGGWLVTVSRIGIAARGIVFIAIGWILGSAARDHDPSKAGGIAAGLDRLATLGRLPLAAIGAGLVAYGFYQLLNARYRSVKAG